MPSLGSHMVRAYALAEKLSLPEINMDRNSFYLGSTAPDIRVITKGDRADTHFYSLEDLHYQDSVAVMLDRYPQLKKIPDREKKVVAFIAGYITHLVLDTAWIEEIYRPTFGVYSSINDDPKSNILDRVLQYELDMRDRSDLNVIKAVSIAINIEQSPPSIPFIKNEYLIRWFDMMNDVIQQKPDYSGFKRMLSRHLKDAGYDEVSIDKFSTNPETIIEEAFGVVTDERLSHFWEKAEQEMFDQVRHYLR